ncbi:hypothetical protein [Neobacillus drentensis]|uniref:hypothetical protein n=1 Tax=Neobacillus drentensis TaxID=220684 RepID=UPI002FFFE368
MPRKASIINEGSEEDANDLILNDPQNVDETVNLSRMLAAVMNYLTDEDLEELDVEYLLDATEGLREWWEQYRESNRKQMEEEIKKSLGELSLEELEKIREKIKEKQDKR